MAISFQPAELIIFDWDGTLFDSVGQIVRSLLYAAEYHQLELSSEAAQSIIGLGLNEVMQTLFPQDIQLHADLITRYSQHYVANSTNDRWFDGVDQMLNALNTQQVKLAVATGKSRAGLDRVLTQTQSQHVFDVTRAASETRSKPDPLMLEEILAHTGVSVERAIMVGDSSYDLEMAQNIGMRAIGVSYGVHSQNILAQYNPILIVNNIASLHAELMDLLQIRAKV